MKIGDKVTIYITGMTSLYDAEVVGMDDYNQPILKVIGDKSYPILKSGDYIITEGHYGTSTIGSNSD